MILKDIRIFKKIRFLLIIVFLMGYVQFFQEGIAQVTTSNSINISGKLRRSYCTEYFGLVDFTFENATNNWVRLSELKVHFGNDDVGKNVNVPYGEELYTSFESIAMKAEIDRFNRELLLGSMGFIGAIASQSRDRKLSRSGAMLGASALGVLSASRIIEMKHDIEQAGLFPKDHIYSGEVLIPPGLFTKRWILLNTKNDGNVPFISELYIEYVTDKGDRENLKLKLRKHMNAEYCHWQKSMAPKKKRKGKVR